MKHPVSGAGHTVSIMTTEPVITESAPFKIGDTAFYRAHSGQIYAGTVIQIEGGPSGDLTEVLWTERDQALWLPTVHLFNTCPDWSLSESCVCGCRFGDHSPSGCVEHDVHRFTPAVVDRDG